MIARGSKLARPGRAFVLAIVVLSMWLPANVARAAELVMFETAGCPWCEAWDREVGVVYGKTEAGRRAPLRRVALDGPRPADLGQIDDIVYTPTFVLLDEGREIGRILGYPGDNHFWGLLGMILDNLSAAPGS
jgi:thioredoxin-related protein